MVVKTNGKTLNGQIRTNFQYVRDHIEMCPQIKGVTLSFGNIDVRHHICRLDADWREMWRNYKKFGDSLPIEVEYAIPWPAEFEGRKLPKTGWYKDQPFWGSQLERSRLVEDIASFCDEIGMNAVHYPAEWRTMDSEVYAKERMEKPQSVHLSPKHYRRHNWGVPMKISGIERPRCIDGSCHSVLRWYLWKTKSAINPKPFVVEV